MFGSVTSSDIGDALEKKGFNVDRRKVQLHEALRTLGEFMIPIKLHKDVISKADRFLAGSDRNLEAMRAALSRLQLRQ